MQVSLAYALSMRVLFVSSTFGIVFNPSADAVTDDSQSAKYIDPYFKFQLYVEDPATESRYSFYRMSWLKPESERTTEIKFYRSVGF